MLRKQCLTDPLLEQHTSKKTSLWQRFTSSCSEKFSSCKHKISGFFSLSLEILKETFSGIIQHPFVAIQKALVGYQKLFAMILLTGIISLSTYFEYYEQTIDKETKDYKKIGILALCLAPIGSLIELTVHFSKIAHRKGQIYWPMLIQTWDQLINLFNLRELSEKGNRNIHIIIFSCLSAMWGPSAGLAEKYEIEGKKPPVLLKLIFALFPYIQGVAASSSASMAATDASPKVYTPEERVNVIRTGSFIGGGFNFLFTILNKSKIFAKGYRFLYPKLKSILEKILKKDMPESPPEIKTIEEEISRIQNTALEFVETGSFTEAALVTLYVLMTENIILPTPYVIIFTLMAVTLGGLRAWDEYFKPGSAKQEELAQALEDVSAEYLPPNPNDNADAQYIEMTSLLSSNDDTKDEESNGTFNVSDEEIGHATNTADRQKPVDETTEQEENDIFYDCEEPDDEAEENDVFYDCEDPEEKKEMLHERKNTDGEKDNNEFFDYFKKFDKPKYPSDKPLVTIEISPLERYSLRCGG